MFEESVQELDNDSEKNMGRFYRVNNAFHSTGSLFGIWLRKKTFKEKNLQKQSYTHRKIA